MSEVRPELKRQVRFNLQEIQSALRARHINLDIRTLAKMEVGQLLVILSQENVGVLIGAYHRPFGADITDTNSST